MRTLPPSSTFFHLHSPYPHAAPAEAAASPEFAALPDIGDTRPASDGVIRVRNNDGLSLEFASSSGYHIIDSALGFADSIDAKAEADLHKAAATKKHFGGDDTWSAYQSFEVKTGESVTHKFPEGFHAHWVRVVSDTATTATAHLKYGPVE